MKRRVYRRVIGPFLSLVLCLQPVLVQAQSIVVDPASPPGAGSASLDVTQSGIPQVNIAQPNSAGLSHNLFTQYGVTSTGLILNNATTITTTQLAGAVYGNSNLNGHSANIILNEVTGTSASALDGYTEVAGQKAAVVIANPNGISCAGCGFINTSRTTLTTGKPNIASNGNLTGFTVNQGNVDFEGQGGDFTQSPILDVISRSVTVNAPVNGGAAINVIAGRNQVAYGSNQTTALAANGTATPNFAIDSSALGGMYAGKILIDATEAGVGVNQNGTLAANAGQMTLTANGDLVNAGSVEGQGDTSVTAGNVTNNGTIGSVAGNVGLMASGTLNNGGTIETAGTANVQAASIGNIGSILGDTSNTVTSNNALTNAGQIGSANGALMVNAASITNQSGGVLGAGAGLTATATGDFNNAGSIAAASALTLASASLENSGVMASQNAGVTLTSGSLTNSTAGSVAAGTTLDVAITGDVNNSGSLVGDTGLTLNAATLENQANASLGAVAGNAGLTVTGAATNAGTLVASAGDLTINAASLSNSGTLAGRDTASITTTSNNAGITNSGTIAAETGALTLTSASLNNQINGAIGAGTSLNATIAGDASNSGSVVGDSGLTLTAASFKNLSGASFGAVSGPAKLTITGAAMNAGTVAASAGDLTFSAASLNNSGHLTGNDNATVTTTGAITNSGSIAATNAALG